MGMHKHVGSSTRVTQCRDDGAAARPRTGRNLPAALTRTMDGTITDWPPSMERRYGFTSEQAIGRKSHQLLRTVFPDALQAIEATLLREHSWHGGLIQRHANGMAVAAMSDWDLVQHDNEPDNATVTEVHSDTISVQLADLLTILANELSQPLAAISNYVNGAKRTLQGERPNPDVARKAMAMAADQIVRSAEHVKLLRSLSDDLRSTGRSRPGAG
jgi:PAS domain-containing protein